MSSIGINLGQQYTQAALMVSLLSVWLLVGLFYYLNRYTKRDYFTVWTAAWLFYALWLTLSLNVQSNAVASDDPTTVVFMLKQWCVSISAVFLLWGSLRFLQMPVRQTLFGLFMLFLIVWTFVSPQVLDKNTLQIQLPVFILLGLSSVFAGVCFYRLRKDMPFVGAGMLSVGFLLWGIYLASYPFSQGTNELKSAGFFIAATAATLYCGEHDCARPRRGPVQRRTGGSAEIATVRSEKEALQVKVLTTEEQCRNLYDKMSLTEGVQNAYNELRRTQQGVVQQERLRALGQMASGIAHDVNNAMSPIVAYSDLLLSTLPDLPGKSREYLQAIKKSGEDVAHIVARMREFYRRRSDAEPLLPLNINKIIEEVIELTRPRWRDLSQREGISIQIRRELESPAPILLSDPTELREVLINLVFNAVDALPQGGAITFVTRTFWRVAAEAGKQESELQVEVRDNGIGMDEKIRQRCLEPFFSTKAQRGGSGLGLAMVYGVMHRHDGTIDIESSPGRGTCARLTFPIREKVSSIKDSWIAQDVASEVKQNRALRVLCIDDEPQIRQLLNDCLTNFNHRVTVASTGKRGTELFREAMKRNQPYEAVITDLGMPEVDGHQVARTIKTESPNTPVIMLTGWGTMMKEDGETIQQVDAVVSKPPHLKELNELLLRVTASNNSAA